MFEKFKDKKKYCDYFKYVSMLAILGLAIMVFTLISSKKLDIQALPGVLGLLVSYFQSRLLYTMCLD